MVHHGLKPVHTVNADADEVGFGQLIWAVDSARGFFPQNTTSRWNADADEQLGGSVRMYNI